jgi:hypothetical protein
VNADVMKVFPGPLDEPQDDEPQCRIDNAATLEQRDVDENDRTLLAAVRDGRWLDAQKFDPLTYAVDGLIPEGFTLLAGPPKAGKSWLALAVQLAVASPNGHALGVIPTGATGRRVLYLALEDGDRRMQDRCRALLADGAPIPTLFHYQTRIVPGAIIATIVAFRRRYPDTALVVIDTLGKVMPPALPGESSYQRDYRIGSRLKTIADDCPGLAVVVLHHDRKAGSDDFVDTVSGTNGLAGAADTIIVLARARHSSDGVLMITGRDVEENEYALSISDGRWTLDGADLATAAKQAAIRRESGSMSDRTAEVLAAVRERPEGIGAAAVADGIGIDRKQVDTYLGRLFKDGRIIRPKRGLYAPLPASDRVGSVGSVRFKGDDPDPIQHSNTSNTASGATAADAVPVWPASETGPCTRCDRPTHRYGDGGQALCAVCRELKVTAP